MAPAEKPVLSVRKGTSMNKKNTLNEYLTINGERVRNG
jgi:hypothetical protein